MKLIFVDNKEKRLIFREVAEAFPEALRKQFEHKNKNKNARKKIEEDTAKNLATNEELVKKTLEETEKDPQAFFRNALSIRRKIPKSDWLKNIEKAFEIYPTGIRNYMNLLKQVFEPQLESTRILQNNPEVAALLNDLVKHGLSKDDALKTMDDNDALFKALVRIKAEPNHLGRVSVEEELQKVSLNKIKLINDLHGQADTIRFNSVENYTLAELYSLMVYGEEEIYTSSFNGLFNRLLDKMKKENLNGDQLFEKVDWNKFRTFIKDCAICNRLNEFLATMSDETSGELLSCIVNDLDIAEDKLVQATIVADIFSMVTDEKILKILREQIKLEYNRVANKADFEKEDKVLYGILAKMFGKKAVINEAWIEEMSEKLNLGNLTELKSTELFNRDGTNIQQYFFYNDADGKASFNSFLSQYQGKSGWRVEKKGHYVTVKSTNKGKKVEIYANYPEFEDGAPKDIQTTVVVHRGHAYHTSKTIEGIPAMASIVTLGSCGGGNRIRDILERAPQVHILLTKGKGTMAVNDPLLTLLNSEILTGEDINWPEFWNKAERKLGNNKDFENYVPPHKNLGVMFLKAYYKTENK